MGDVDVEVQPLHANKDVLYFTVPYWGGDCSESKPGREKLRRSFGASLLPSTGRAGTQLLQGEPQGPSPECPLLFVFKAAR